MSSSRGAQGVGLKFLSAMAAAQKTANRCMTQTATAWLKRRLQKTEMATATARPQDTRAWGGVGEHKLSTVNLRYS